VSVSKKVLRCLFWGALAIYGVAAAGLLGVRYWVLPRVDEWRPQIEAYASRTLGAQVRIGEIRADWQGLNPRLDLDRVRVYESGDGASPDSGSVSGSDPVLTLPAVSAVLGWRSVLALSPTLIQLRVDRPELTLRRDAGNHLWVAGQSIDLNTSDHQADLNHPALRWLARQREIVLRDATLRWQDERRQAPELLLRNVNLLVRNGQLSHRFALSAAAEPALGRRLGLRGEFNRSLFSAHPADPASWSGQLYAELDDAEPAAWRPWLDVPPWAGRIGARAWLALEHGKFTDLTADAALRGLAWRSAEDGPALRAGQIQVHVQGKPGDFLAGRDLPFARSPGAPDLSVRAVSEQVQADLPGIFEQPTLEADRLELSAGIKGADARDWYLDVGQLRLQNADLELRLRGQWYAQGKTAAGRADISGTLVRAAMPAIHRYLPLEVNRDAREWLSTGLRAGELSAAALTLRGDLSDFPFAAPGDEGEFVLAGNYAGATVDYAPAHGHRKGWPVLENLSGSFRIDKVSLSLDSRGGAWARTGPEHKVALGQVNATIPNMEHEAELLVDGQTSGPVPAYLAMAANSPLGGLLDGALDEARGTGDWRLALKLRVPLFNADDTQVEGRISFADNTFSLMPEMPALSQLRGTLEFSETGLRVPELRGQFLGGPARISGQLGQPSDRLAFDGTLAASQLTQVSNTPSMSRFSGKASYRGQLGYQKGGAVEIAVQSDLAGMAIDMPAPMGKTAQASRLLKVQWGAAQDHGARNRRWLTFTLGDEVNGLFEHDPADASASYFNKAAIGIGRPASLPDRGLSFNVQMPETDIDGWETVGDGFEAPPGKGRRASRPMLPPVDRVSLSTGLMRLSGYTLHSLTLFATRPAPNQWRVDIDSRQAAGALEWREASGAIAGQITARLKHLSLGGPDDTNQADQALSSSSDLSDIPAVDLRAEEFLLYGKKLGTLTVRGTNLERGRRWRLDQLAISNPQAGLNATGQWRLDGADRGLTVDAEVKFADLGGFLDRIGFQQVASGGTGTVKGNVTWRNLPWTHRIADLSGEAEVSLDKGRFMHVNSRTARLLELLSLQSLQRLARLDVNPTNLLREGFPFDTVRGQLKLADGLLSTEGYKINGPVAAIVLAGSVNLILERWDMKAVVIPNLDASGAAVVTALAVNPLIGLGAFVTQWLLKQPLARAMTVQYRVTGSWDDPKIEPEEETQAGPGSPARPQSGPGESWPESGGR